MGNKTKGYLPQDYQRNNPNILKRIDEDRASNGSYHYLFIGNAGCGKTVLATLLAHDYARRLKGTSMDAPYFVKVRTFYREYLSLLNSNYTDVYAAMKGRENKFKSRYAIIDDIGDERPSTPSANEYIGGMLEERYDYIKTCEAKKTPCWTIGTTNLNQKQLMEKYGSRVVDRIEEMFTIMKFKDTSFRRKKREIIKE